MNYNYRPLIISKNFCEEFNPVGYQVRIFVDALISNGVNPEIYAKAIDNSDAIASNYDLNLINELPHRYIQSLMRKVMPDIISLPDIELFTFFPSLKRQLRKSESRILEYDWIHTVSNPCSNHLIGLAIKKKYNLPWVAHFYDPWVDNNYREFKIKYLRAYDEKLESEIAHNADVIIHTNDIVKEKWISRYGELVSEKIFILPICYKENIKIESHDSNPLNNQAKIILYVGGLYLDRNLNNVINAIKILRADMPDIKNKLIFKIIGSCSRSVKASVKESQVEDMFLFLGYKPHNQLNEFYNEADVLLVIDAPGEENMFFPSKITEYLLLNKPILGLTPNKSVTHDILKESGHTYIENKNEERIASYLKDLITNPIERFTFDRDYYQRFLIDTNTHNFLKVIEAKLIDFRHKVNKK